jgi:fermentation-respiration switch protein FrsA (DUF1100 family)
MKVPLSELQPESAIRHATFPILLINGDQDAHTSLEDAKRLFNNAPHPKQLWIVRGARHVDLYAFAGARYEHAVLQFFESSRGPRKNKKDPA